MTNDTELHMLAAFRQRRTTRGRRVLAAFVVAWLAIFLQPCAMAMGVEEHDCPHCPPAEMLAMAPCEMASNPDCAFDDEINADARSLQLKLKDAPQDLPVAMAPIVRDWLQPAFVARPLPHTRILLDPGGPPLNILYCVYLK